MKITSRQIVRAVRKSDHILVFFEVCDKNMTRVGPLYDIFFYFKPKQLKKDVLSEP